MTPLSIELLKQGETPKNPIPDNQWYFETNLEKIFIIEKAVVLEFNDGRYPQVQLVVREPESGKFIAIGTTFRLLKGVISFASGVAERQGLKDF